MYDIENEIVCEQKMDEIMESLEELILNAILSVIRKLKTRDDLFNKMDNPCGNNDEIEF